MERRGFLKTLLSLPFVATLPIPVAAAAVATVPDIAVSDGVVSPNDGSGAREALDNRWPILHMENGFTASLSGIEIRREFRPFSSRENYAEYEYLDGYTLDVTINKYLSGELPTCGGHGWVKIEMNDAATR